MNDIDPLESARLEGTGPTPPPTRRPTVGLAGAHRHEFSVDTECECGVRLSTLVRQGHAAMLRLRALVAAEDRFVAETGVPLNDGVADEVERARFLLSGLCRGAA